MTSRDNRIENLQLMTHVEHERMESTGRTFSAEARQKISVVHKGKPKNYDVWNKGKKGVYSEELRRKISLRMVGKHPSTETLKKKSQSLRLAWQERKAVVNNLNIKADRIISLLEERLPQSKE